MFFKKKKDFGGNNIDALIVGLGNPGDKYDMTRHNAGFMVTDCICDKYGVKLNKVKFKGVFGTFENGSKKIIVLQPQTYMNNSGESVREIMDFYKLTPDKLIVICDDISLDVGKMRIRKKGSDGGQRGMRSIITHLNTSDFVRIKVGVGAKPNPEYDLADWVLSKFHGDEIKSMEQAVINAAESAIMIVNGEIDKAMNRYNS